MPDAAPHWTLRQHQAARVAMAAHSANSSSWPNKPTRGAGWRLTGAATSAQAAQLLPRIPSNTECAGAHRRPQPPIDAAGAETGWKRGATGAGSAALLLLSKGKLLLLA